MNDVWERIKEAATVLDMYDTYRVWKHRGKVPPSRHHELVQASKNTEYSLTYEQLNSL